MRRLMVTMLASAVALLGLAGAASAHNITLSWTGTTGTGATGGTDIAVGSDTLTLNVTVNWGATGMFFTAVSFGWDPAALSFSSLVAGTECPLPVTAPGTCWNNDALIPPFQSGTPVAAGVTVTGNVASSLDLLAASIYNGPAFTTLAQLVFTTTGSSGYVDLFYKPGVDNILDSAGNVITGASTPLGLNSAHVSGAVIPEPTTAALLGLGLGTLAFAGRRRKR